MSEERFELSRISPLGPKPSASTNSATPTILRDVSTPDFIHEIGIRIGGIFECTIRMGAIFECAIRMGAFVVRYSDAIKTVSVSLY